MDDARGGPGRESGRDAMGDERSATQGEAAAKPGLGQQARDSVRDARDQVATQVRERAEAAREGASRAVEDRKQSVAGSVQALASAFEAAAASLSDGNQARLAELTRELSGRTQRIAAYLERQDTGGLVRDLEGTAREHPTAFLGTSFAAGLVAGRFLRSSQRATTDAGALSTNEGAVDFEFVPDDALLGDESSTGASAGSRGPTGESFGSRLGEVGGYGASGSTREGGA